jgi:hypothetical protein
MKQHKANGYNLIPLAQAGVKKFEKRGSVGRREDQSEEVETKVPREQTPVYKI